MFHLGEESGEGSGGSGDRVGISVQEASAITEKVTDIVHEMVRNDIVHINVINISGKIAAFVTTKKEAK